MIKLLSFLLLFSATTITAQQQQIEGELSTIAVDGLHKIKIPHTVRSYSKQDIRDFRIWDSKGNQVPYFVHTDDKETRISNFSEFPMLYKTSITDTSATYIFKNPGEKIQKAVLSIANYQGSKRFSLQGSDNQKQWFGLVNSQELYNLSSINNTSVYKVIDFPLCSYQYLKIVFDDRNSLPINLLKIGTATTEIIKSAMEEIPVKTSSATELDIKKKTRLRIIFEHPEIINQVNFDIATPELYNRNVKIYALKTKEVKHKLETYQQQIAYFKLRSDGSITFPINSFFEKELYIEIENEDNPKLVISSLKFLQTPFYVIADLKQNERYTITSGDATLKTPKYDISYFRDRISENIPKANIVAVKYNQPETTEKAAVSFWQQSWFLWLCIGFAAVVIAYFASSLIKDLKKENG